MQRSAGSLYDALTGIEFCSECNKLFNSKSKLAKQQNRSQNMTTNK